VIFVTRLNPQDSSRAPYSPTSLFTGNYESHTTIFPAPPNDDQELVIGLEA